MPLSVSKQIGIVASIVGAITGVIAIYEFVMPRVECPRFDLTGSWTVKTEVEAVSQKEYVGELGKTNTFVTTLWQECKTISGTATKATYAGKAVLGKNRSHLAMRVVGISEKEIRIIFTETWEGAKAQSNGLMVLKVSSSGNALSGRFNTAIGGIDGSVYAERDTKGQRH